MWSKEFRASFAAAAAVAGVLLAAGCTDDTGPGRVVYGRFALEPVFVSEAAGIVPVTAGRFVLRRTADAVVVKDTVIALGEGADSVDLTLSVPVSGPGETFELTIALIGTAGDTVFRAGPLTVTPAVGGETPPAIPVPVVYTGVGADASSVQIQSPLVDLFFGQQLTLQAVVLDSAGQPIPNTPVEWRTLDSARLGVARPDSGRVIAGTERGLGRIVARLLTGQVDTIGLLVQATPSTIAVDGGNNQSGAPGTELPQALVARVLAVDALGVEGIWVRFAVTAGGGSLSADSVLTDALGRAFVNFTLGASGPQIVEATTAQLGGQTAVFGATVVAGARTVSWVNPSGGTWGSGANWSVGTPPGPQDTAVIALAGTYTVALDVSPTIAAFTLGGATGTQSLDATGLQTLTLAGNGSIGPNGRVDLVNGDLLLAGGNVLTLNGGTVRVGVDHSLLLGIGGDASELTYAAGGIGGPGGLFLSPGAQLNVEAPLSLDSLVLVVNDAEVNDGGAGRLLIQPAAALLLQSQTGATVNLVVENQGVVTATGGANFLTGETFTNAAGNPSLQIPPGVIGGEGTLDVSGTTFVNDGTIAPGLSPGLLGLTGTYPGSPTSLLDIELGGTAVGTGYDRLAVSGAAALDGALNVTLVNGFAPGLGDQFTILTYGSVSGAFRTVTLPTLPLGLLWQTTTNPTSMVLSVTGPPPQIVFAGDSAGRSIGVFRVNPDASGLFNVTTEGKDGANPRWSPDRARITYSARATFGVPNQLHVISADGGLPAHLTDGQDTSTWYPRYNPTGKHLAFECGDGFGEFDVCVVPNVDGDIASLENKGNGTGKFFVTDFDQANRKQGPGAFAWDPVTMDRLAWVRDSLGISRIFTSLFDGADVQPLSAEKLDVGNGPLSITGRMDWSSDGNRLVFGAQDGRVDQKLYLINRDGSGFTQLTSGAGFDVNPVFSPDGQTVLFARDVGCSLDLWRVDVSSGAEEQVTAEGICDFDTSVLGYDWRPDGSEIVLTGFETAGGNLLIYVIPATTKAADYLTVRRIAGRGADAPFQVQDIQPSWRP